LIIHSGIHSERYSILAKATELGCSQTHAGVSGELYTVLNDILGPTMMK